jgi:hypothetical protein
LTARLSAILAFVNRMASGFTIVRSIFESGFTGRIAGSVDSKTQLTRGLREAITEPLGGSVPESPVARVFGKDCKTQNVIRLETLVLRQMPLPAESQDPIPQCQESGTRNSLKQRLETPWHEKC